MVHGTMADPRWLDPTVEGQKRKTRSSADDGEALATRSEIQALIYAYDLKRSGVSLPSASMSASALLGELCRTFWWLREQVLDLWWAVLGSNQWPLPCETEVGCL